MEKTKQQLRTRRYYLHRSAKTLATVVSKTRTLYLPVEHCETGNKYILELRDFLSLRRAAHN